MPKVTTSAVDDDKAGDKPSTVDKNCPSVPKVTTSAVDDGKAGDKPSAVDKNCPSVPKVTTSAVDDGKVVVDGPTSEKEGTVYKSCFTSDNVHTNSRCV